MTPVYGVLGIGTLACLLVVAAAEQATFGEVKNYAPPYGTPSGSSPAMGPSPSTPTYSPTPSSSSPLVPSIGPSSSPYNPTPTTPSSPASSSPGTCMWWSSNTSSFPSFIDLLTTVISLFSSITGGGSSGSSSIIGSIFGNQMTIYQGLTNTRNDAYGALLRQSSAAILNSYTRRDYTYTPFQVKLNFRSALANEQSASRMATLFENANNALGRRI